LEITDIFFEFSNRGRLDLFKSLYESDKKHSELVEELEVPGSEISRHLKRLREKKLIIKKQNNRYTVSNIGKIFYNIFEIFEVTVNHKSFFNSHDIMSIPLYLFVELGNLKTLEMSDKTMQNIELWSNLVKNSEEFIYAISDQFQISILPIVERKLQKKSIEIKALINKTLIKSYNIPDEWANKFDDASAFYKKLDIYENVRILTEINLSLIVSDKGGILFLKKNNSIDYSECLIDNHPNFINWCMDIFKFYWRKGDSLRPFIKRETKSL
jgi:predicted transcriptional regulator